MLLEVADLDVHYGKVQALSDVSIDVAEGEHVAVLGPNGAGKTTLMRTIMGQKQPSAGTIRLDGEEMTGLPSWDRAAGGLAYIPEGGRVFPDATVVQNLKTGAYLTEGDQVDDRMRDVFDLFPRLDERRSQKAGTLSGGEQQMLAIGRAVMSEPRCILVDEISMGLMPTLVDRAFEVLADLNERGIALLQVEQNVHKTLPVVDRAYVLENGRVQAEGTPEELAESGAIEATYLGIEE